MLLCKLPIGGPHIIKGDDYTLETAKSSCGEARYLEISYGDTASFNFNAGSGKELEECRNIGMVMKGITGTPKPSQKDALTLESARCWSNSLDPYFPSVTSVTTKGVLHEECFIKLQKLTHLTINWPNTNGVETVGSERVVSTNFGEVKKVPNKLSSVLRVLGAALDKEILKELATVESFKELWIVCGANRRAVFKFMQQKNLKFEKITLIFADVNDEMLDNPNNFDQINTHTDGLKEFEKYLAKKTNWLNKWLHWFLWFKDKQSAENFLKLWTKVEYVHGDGKIPTLTFEVCIYSTLKATLIDI